jgi:hypothetical protein
VLASPPVYCEGLVVPVLARLVHIDISVDLGAAAGRHGAVWGAPGVALHSCSDRTGGSALVPSFPRTPAVGGLGASRPPPSPPRCTCCWCVCVWCCSVCCGCCWWPMSACPCPQGCRPSALLSYVFPLRYARLPTTVLYRTLCCPSLPLSTLPVLPPAASDSRDLDLL